MKLYNVKRVRSIILAFASRVAKNKRDASPTRNDTSVKHVAKKRYMVPLNCSCIWPNGAAMRDIYVVHAIPHERNARQYTEARFEYQAFDKAFKTWKTYVIGGHRAAIFHWSADGACLRLYATADYGNRMKDHG